MARPVFFPGLRRRRRVFCTGLIYALLLNVLIAGLFQAQAIAATLDPVATAATCDGTGTGGGPVRHSSQHQPDCTLCCPACPMIGAVPALGGGIAHLAPHPTRFALDASAAPRASVIASSVYLSDAFAQAPPAIA